MRLSFDFFKVFTAALMFTTLFLWLHSLHDVQDDYQCSNCNVILIVVDTLRADHMGCYGYGRETTPFIDAFAQESMFFEYAVTAAPWTNPSVASIFTSLYPTSHGLTTYSAKNSTKSSVLSDDIVTLAEVLSGSGYNTAGFTVNPWIADYRGFAQGFDYFKSPENPRVRAETVNAEARRILEGEGFTEKPFFLYLHYMDPHSPYKPPKEYDVFKGSVGGYDYPKKAIKLLNKYDGEILYLDSEINSLFDYLREMDLYDDTIIILTSDHGEQFYEYMDENNHGFTLYSIETHVPLIFKVKGQSRRVEKIVSLIDIYPTILDILDIPIHHQIQGKSLLSTEKKDIESRAFSEATSGGCIKSFLSVGGEKIILNYKGRPGALVSEEAEKKTLLYNLKTDPTEQKPLENDGLEKELRTSFYEIYEQSLGYRENINVTEVELRDHTLDKLKALGYIN